MPKSVWFHFSKERVSRERTFSLLISTRARSPTAFAILLARVLNAPHCLHASTVTVGFPLVAFAFGAAATFFVAAGAFFVLALVAATFFLGGAFLGLGASAAGASGALARRCDRRVATMTLINQRSFRNRMMKGKRTSRAARIWVWGIWIQSKSMKAGILCTLVKVCV